MQGEPQRLAVIASLAQLGEAICFINFIVFPIQKSDGFVPRHDGSFLSNRKMFSFKNSYDLEVFP
jgi:hypothetical protein